MEDELIGRAQAGDHTAFRQLVDTYAGVAWRTARVLLPDRGAAEDAVQEAWVDVWRGLPRFQRGRPFRPWLLTLVANRCRKATRQHVPPHLSLDAGGGGEPSSADDPGDHLLRIEADAALSAVLATLPMEQQRVLALRFFGDLELAEIAAVTDVPLGTVKSRLHRALDTARARLQQQHTCAPSR